MIFKVLKQTYKIIFKTPQKFLLKFICCLKTLWNKYVSQLFVTRIDLFTMFIYT